MRANPKRVQVGDLLYEASAKHNTVIQWVVRSFHLDYETMQTVVSLWSSKFGIVDRSPEEVLCLHDTYSEAKKCLEEMLYDGEDSEDSE